MKIRWLVALALAAALASPVSLAAQQDDAASGQTSEEQEKAEKERRKREEKAEKKEAKEAKESQELLDEIQSDVDALASEMTSRLYPDNFLQDYVNEIGQRLVPRSAAPDRAVSFRVVDDARPNAFALADGRVFVTSGLLVFVRNEAQLAMALAHEAGHVIENHSIEQLKESRSFKRRALPGLLGALGGAVVGGIVKGGKGAAVGATAGLAAGAIYSVVALNRYGRKQEDESDLIGARLMIAQGYDPAEGAALFDLLAERFPDKDRFADLLWAQHSRNVERAAHVRALIGGELASSYNAQKSAGKLTEGTGQLDFFLSRMYREVAIQLMEQFDRYDLARGILERVVEYRARDPRALWAMGRVYKLLGRSAADRARALDYLQRAAQADERNLHPYVYRDLSLMQARLATSAGENMAPAVESMKQYVTLWIERNHAEPPDIEEMYDYLLAFGDAQWLAPPADALVARRQPAGASPYAPRSAGGLDKTDAARAMLGEQKKPKSKAAAIPKPPHP
jgi:predicted Zn-dependent protease